VFILKKLGRDKIQSYSATTAKSRSLAALGMTQGARGHRAGGSEDPPLQLVGLERAEVRMASAEWNAAVAGVDKGERTQRGTVLGAIGGHLGFFGESRSGEAHYRTKIVSQSNYSNVDKIQVVGQFPSAVEAIRQWKFQPNIVQGEVIWTRVRALAVFNADGTTTVDLSPGLLADDFGKPGTTRSAAGVFPRPAAAPTCKSAQPWTGAQAQEIEASEVSPGFYKNNYFGLTFHFPSEWQVADRASLDSIDANQEKSALAQYSAMPSNVHMSKLPYYLLFVARTNGPIGSPGPSVQIWAEKEVFISSADQYFPNKNFLSDKTADGTRGPKEVEISGTKYYRGDRWGKVEGRSIYQVRLVTYTRDLILGVDIIADTSATADNLVNGLQGIGIVPPH
jgi:hypothetical protein